MERHPVSRCLPLMATTTSQTAAYPYLGPRHASSRKGFWDSARDPITPTQASATATTVTRPPSQDLEGLGAYLSIDYTHRATGAIRGCREKLLPPKLVTNLLEATQGVVNIEILSPARHSEALCVKGVGASLTFRSTTGVLDVLKKRATQTY